MRTEELRRIARNIQDRASQVTKPLKSFDENESSAPLTAAKLEAKMSAPQSEDTI